MGFYALYRLLWRPMILTFYLIFAGLIVGLLWAAGTKLPSLSEPGRLILITMALPSIAGVFVGQSVGEIQHTPLSWSISPSSQAALFIRMYQGNRTRRTDNLGLPWDGWLRPCNPDSCLLLPVVQPGIYDWDLRIRRHPHTPVPQFGHHVYHDSHPWTRRPFDQ